MSLFDEVRMLSASEAMGEGLLNPIGRLRRAAWEASGVIPLPARNVESWTEVDDSFDESMHFVIIKDDKLIASARAQHCSTTQGEFSEYRHMDFFEPFHQEMKLEGIVFSRLVVDPALWGQGYGNKLDDARMAYANTCRAAWVALWTPGSRRSKHVHSKWNTKMEDVPPHMNYPGVAITAHRVW